MIVATVLRSGGIYTADWVARLQAQVERWAPGVPFVCFSDLEVPCDRVPLRLGLPGWWSKVEVFALPGPVLYLDLDTLVTGDLGDLLRQARTGGLTMLRDFYRVDGLGSGVMAWSTETRAERIYSRFLAGPEDWMAACRGGDQAFIEAVVDPAQVARWQDVLPGQVVSYKADRCEAGPPDNARLVCLHGRPKFDDMAPGSWARAMWEGSAPGDTVPASTAPLPASPTRGEGVLSGAAS